jgi:hypothetical protein
MMAMVPMEGTAMLQMPSFSQNRLGFCIGGGDRVALLSDSYMV